RFPIITIFDVVRAQFHLLDHLGINKLHASVGSSMGGMQSLAAATLYPERVGRLISISACARSHPYSIAMRHTQRQGKNVKMSGLLIAKRERSLQNLQPVSLNVRSELEERI